MLPIGITTTVPIEILLAAGYKPVDLNNLFVSDPLPERLVDIAERDGFPQNCCAWIKGIYGVCLDRGINTVLCVTTGDCSNTVILMEVLKLKGIAALPFAYPDILEEIGSEDRDPSTLMPLSPISTSRVSRMHHSLEALAETLGTTLEAAEEVRNALLPLRHLLSEVDYLTWKEGVVSGWENHLWLVSSSDFGVNPLEYKTRLELFLAECRQRQPYPQDMLRLAYIGVPPIFAANLYHYLEEQGARVVFNEIQRQFSMPYEVDSLSEQYAMYTYPYSIFDRLHDISTELHYRRIDGIIHYVQTFCYRGIGDIIFRHALSGIPILTLEGNTDYILGQQLSTKIEAFLDMLRWRKCHLLDKVGDKMKGRLYG